MATVNAYYVLGALLSTLHKFSYSVLTNTCELSSSIILILLLRKLDLEISRNLPQITQVIND